ncbi:MAG: tetratricopeptide repeat protein [Lachnospiraceae bacterium]|nr:tetratricopeptide repeat protein [Lachnospiraceae bacterium]
MICYNCGCEVGKDNFCPNCNTDLSIFQKVIRLSNMYYNDGLQKAGVRSLSGAIVSLKKSLKFNKYHIDARNLLGLVYYEMGEVVDALSEWVISQSYQPEENIASYYLNTIRKNRNHLDSCNQTIKKYNQALLYCKQSSRDLAIIQLKKVLSLNPKLVKAHQLLALLYIQEDRLEAAKKSLRNAAKINADNTITLRYQKEVNARLKEKGTKKKKKNTDLISYQSGNETIIMPKRFQETSLAATLAYVVIGLIVGVAVTYFLVVPSIQMKAKQEAKEQVVEMNDTLSSNAQIISRLEEQITDLQVQLEASQKKNEQIPAQIATYEALLNAYAANMAQDYVMAGNNLDLVDMAHLSQAAKSIYNTLSTDVTQKYYEQLYKDGYGSYSRGDYAKAIENLLKVVTKDPAYKDGDASYYLAQAYRKNNNLEAAKPHYQYVIDNYPGTARARTSKNYVKLQ